MDGTVLWSPRPVVVLLSVNKTFPVLPISANANPRNRLEPELEPQLEPRLSEPNTSCTPITRLHPDTRLLPTIERLPIGDVSINQKIAQQ